MGDAYPSRAGISLSNHWIIAGPPGARSPRRRPACVRAHMWAFQHDLMWSGDAVEVVLFEQQIYGFLAEGLCRAAEIEGQHSKLFPGLRR
jgi:hypothetical protein